MRKYMFPPSLKVNCKTVFDFSFREEDPLKLLRFDEPEPIHILLEPLYPNLDLNFYSKVAVKIKILNPLFDAHKISALLQYCMEHYAARYYEDSILLEIAEGAVCFHLMPEPDYYKRIAFNPNYGFSQSEVMKMFYKEFPRNSKFTPQLVGDYLELIFFSDEKLTKKLLCEKVGCSLNTLRSLFTKHSWLQTAYDDTIYEMSKRTDRINMDHFKELVLNGELSTTKRSLHSFFGRSLPRITERFAEELTSLKVID